VTSQGAQPARLTRGERQRQTRDRLLEAARSVFAERGFAGASLDEVAARAGMTKGAVYSNFAGKDELILAVMQRRRVHQQREQNVHVVGDPALPAEDRFRQAGAAYAAAMTQQETRDWALLVMEFWTHAVRDEAARAVLAEGLRDLRRTVQESLETSAGSRGWPPPTPPADLAALVVALDLGLALQHLLDPAAVPAQLYGTALARLLGDNTGAEA
jgi:AcrR family transcriptional regulator